MTIVNYLETSREEINTDIFIQFGPGKLAYSESLLVLNNDRTAGITGHIAMGQGMEIQWIISKENLKGKLIFLKDCY